MSIQTIHSFHSRGTVPASAQRLFCDFGEVQTRSTRDDCPVTPQLIQHLPSSASFGFTIFTDVETNRIYKPIPLCTQTSPHQQLTPCQEERFCLMTLVKTQSPGFHCRTFEDTEEKEETCLESYKVTFQPSFDLWSKSH